MICTAVLKNDCQICVTGQGALTQLGTRDYYFYCLLLSTGLLSIREQPLYFWQHNTPNFKKVPFSKAGLTFSHHYIKKNFTVLQNCSLLPLPFFLFNSSYSLYVMILCTKDMAAQSYRRPFDFFNFMRKHCLSKMEGWYEGRSKVLWTSCFENRFLECSQLCF